MVRLTLNGQEIEAQDGAPLLEVIKQQGIFISNLCYIDGLPPYAGCRTCLVEIEGARGLQLSCTTKVADGMVVRTSTDEVQAARRQVMSIIMANHSDRCLTCHRTVHCRPGDICLRDDIVTHRCLTCSKNYRCELQTTTEMVQMAKFEPWFGEKRSYYEMPEQLPADRGNPYVEFDPQMCIICTRCVRACDELRHTNAITLGGRGFTTQIMFGAGGAIHESTCDFCGTCIDVCPVAALMEHPNKWIGQTNVWTETTCGYCSVGCSIKLGTRSGKGVIVRPDTAANPVSKDQICVRGRFHYDALKQRDRIQRPTMKRGLVQAPVPWDQAIDQVASRLAEIRQANGANAIGFLGSAFSTNEENYLLAKIARAVVDTNNVDHSLGPVLDAVGRALRDAFGTEVLTSDLAQLHEADVILAVGTDIEETHPVASLRIKDGARYGEAKLIVVSPRWGELDEFATARLRPAPRAVPNVLGELVQRVLDRSEIGERAATLGGRPDVSVAESGAPSDAIDVAAALIIDAALDPEKKIAIVYAPGHVDSQSAEAATRTLATLALLCRPEAARSLLCILGPEVNAIGMRDVGLAPGLLPGYRQASSDPDRRAIAELWHALPPAAAGMGFSQMLDAAKAGSLKALVVLRDNPAMLAPDSGFVYQALESLEYLVVIDEVMTETASLADVVLPEVSMFGRDGTFTSADRRVLMQRAAVAPQGEARQAWQILAALGSVLTEKLGVRDVSFNYANAADVMEEIALLVPLYAGAHYDELISGERQHLPDGEARAGTLQPIAAPFADPTERDGRLLLMTYRDQFSSYEASAIRHPEAEPLHRREQVEMHPSDADELGIANGDVVQLVGDAGEMTIAVRFSEHVQPGTLLVPLYYQGGAVMRLFGREGEAAAAPLVSVRAAVPA